MKPYGPCSFSLTEADPRMYWSVEGSFEVGASRSVGTDEAYISNMNYKDGKKKRFFHASVRGRPATTQRSNGRLNIISVSE